MISLKTRIRLTVAALVAFVVVLVSVVYLYDFTGSAIDSAAESARQIAGEVAGYVVERVDQNLSAMAQRPTDRQQLRDQVANIIRTDPLIPAMLTRNVSTNAAVLDILLFGPDGKMLTSFTGTSVPGTRPGGRDRRCAICGSFSTKRRTTRSRFRWRRRATKRRSSR